MIEKKQFVLKVINTTRITILLEGNGLVKWFVMANNFTLRKSWPKNTNPVNIDSLKIIKKGKLKTNSKKRLK